MAFDSTKLVLASVGAPANGPRLWLYDGSSATGSNDLGATITAINYFRASSAGGGPRPGDFVFYRGSDNANGIVTFTTITTSVSTGVKYSSSALA